jgi:hypothetical protein
VACQLFATFTGHKLFQLVQLHDGVAMNTFIGSLFRWNLSLAHFTTDDVRKEEKNFRFSLFQAEVITIIMEI